MPSNDEQTKSLSEHSTVAPQELTAIVVPSAENQKQDPCDENYPPPPYAAALLVDDPPKIGNFWLDARLSARPSGVAYLAHEADEIPVMLIVLSDGAANDAAARDRFAGEINKLHLDTVIARGGQGQNTGRTAHTFRTNEGEPVVPSGASVAPWAALVYDETMNAVAESDRILRSVDLSATPQIGSPAGPDYALHWIDNFRPGAWRVWPLLWPGRRDRAGWMTILVSLLLMLLLAALALLIVVLIFQNSPPESPPPPVSPPSATTSQTASASSSASPSTSPSDSKSATPSESSSTSHKSPSKDPSMMDSGSSSSASGSPNKRL